MRKLTLRVGVGFLLVVLLAALGLFGYRWVTHIEGDALQGRWVSERAATLSYWHEHYDWAADERLVRLRSEKLGRMHLEINKDRLSLIDHPCHGNFSARYRITEREGDRYEIAIDEIVTWIHFATLVIDGDRLWSVVQMDDQELREAFVRVNDGN